MNGDKMDRRCFLRKAGKTAAGAAAISVFPTPVTEAIAFSPNVENSEEEKKRPDRKALKISIEGHTLVIE